MQYKTNIATPGQHNIIDRPITEQGSTEHDNTEHNNTDQLQAHTAKANLPLPSNKPQKKSAEQRRCHFSQGLALLSLISMPLAHAEETSTQSALTNDIATTDNATQGAAMRGAARTPLLAQNFLPKVNSLESPRHHKRQQNAKPNSALQGLGFDFSVTAKAHTGHFDWSIASDMTGTRSPNILSELSYESLDVNIVTYDFVKRFSLTQAFTGLFELSYSKGGINNGTVYDADYYGDYRTDPKSLSESDPSGSDISAHQITLGLTRSLTQSTQLSLLGGYAQNNQAFVKRQGLQLFSASTAGVPSEGTTFNNLNSTYKTTWKSGFIGTQLTHTTGAHRFNFRAEFHGADYYAEADWNLRSAFQHPKSFEHIADGTGLSAQFSYAYALDENLQFTLSANHEQWQTRDGLDRVFFASGRTVTTRLLETNWESIGYGIGITYTGGL